MRIWILSFMCSLGSRAAGLGGLSVVGNGTAPQGDDPSPGADNGGVSGSLKAKGRGRYPGRGGGRQSSPIQSAFPAVQKAESSSSTSAALAEVRSAGRIAKKKNGPADAGSALRLPRPEVPRLKRLVCSVPPEGIEPEQTPGRAGPSRNRRTPWNGRSRVHCGAVATWIQTRSPGWPLSVSCKRVVLADIAVGQLRPATRSRERDRAAEEIGAVRAGRARPESAAGARGPAPPGPPAPPNRSAVEQPGRSARGYLERVGRPRGARSAVADEWRADPGQAGSAPRRPGCSKLRGEERAVRAPACSPTAALERGLRAAPRSDVEGGPKPTPPLDARVRRAPRFEGLRGKADPGTAGETCTSFAPRIWQRRDRDVAAVCRARPPMPRKRLTGSSVNASSRSAPRIVQRLQSAPGRAAEAQPREQHAFACSRGS